MDQEIEKTMAENSASNLEEDLKDSALRPLAAACDLYMQAYDAHVQVARRGSTEDRACAQKRLIAQIRQLNQTVAPLNFLLDLEEG